MASEARRAAAGILFAALALVFLESFAAADGIWPESAGTVTAETPLYEDYDLGNYAADAIRDAGGTKLALIGNGFVRRAEEGECFELARGTVTLRQLQTMMEAGFAAVRTDSQTETVVSEPEELDGFLQISGFYCSYDAAAPAGQRLMSLEISGEETSGEGPFSVTAPAGLLAGAGIPEEALDADVLQAAQAYQETWTGGDTFSERRIRILGTRDGSLISMFPRWMRIVLPLLACILVGQALLRNKRWRDAHGVFLHRR